MNIYQNMHKIAKLKKRLLSQDNMFLCKLIGVNVETNANDVVHIFPVYRPFMRMLRFTGQIMFEFPGKKKSLVILIGRRIEVALVNSDEVLQPHSDIGKE